MPKNGYLKTLLILFILVILLYAHFLIAYIQIQYWYIALPAESILMTLIIYHLFKSPPLLKDD